MGNVRVVIALFGQSKDIKESSNLTRRQPLIYFGNSSDRKSTETRLNDDTQTFANLEDDQDAAARTYYCYCHHLGSARNGIL